MEWGALLQAFADQYDPRAKSIGPNWREVERREIEFENLRKEMLAAQVKNINDMPEARRRDDEMRAEIARNRELADMEEILARQTESGERFEIESLQKREAAEMRATENAADNDRAERSMAQSDRHHKESLQQRADFEAARERANSEPKSVTPSQWYELGTVKGFGNKETFDPNIANERERRYMDRNKPKAQFANVSGGGSSVNAEKEKARASAEKKNPSASVMEIEEAQAKENAAVADLNGSSKTGGKPAMLDTFVPKSGELSPDVVKGLNEFRQAAMGSTKGDPKAAELLSKMIDERQLSRIQEKYGSEAIDQMRQTYQEIFKTEAPF